MKKISFLRCINCMKEHELKDVIYICDACGSNLEVIYDYNLIKKRFKLKDLENNRFYDIWRYLDLLPADDLKGIAPLRVGYTPLYRLKKLADEYDVEMIYIKDDSVNPSFSFKDRATAVVIKRMIDVMSSDKVVISCASTGNAASSTACLSASVGVKSVIFVPSRTPEPKLFQIFMYGAGVINVEGNYDDAYELCNEACSRFGWFNRNTGYNPFTREGKKTVSFEIAEQLEWEVPDIIFVPVGDGNIISGVWKGFLEFKKVGLIDKLPKLVAVQPISSNSIALAVENQSDTIVIKESNPSTICDSVAVRMPKDGLAAVISVKESGGFSLTVSDEEVVNASIELASKTGIFAEPSGALAFAGFKKAKREKKIDDNKTVLLLITGNGFKSVSANIDKLVKKHGIRIEPDIRDLERHLRDVVD